MKKRNILDKIAEKSHDIVFGMLSGTGLFFLVMIATSWVIYFLPNLEKHFLIIYIALHLFILIGTAKMYTKGLFRVIYVVLSLILLFVYIYTKLLTP